MGTWSGAGRAGRSREILVLIAIAGFGILFLGEVASLSGVPVARDMQLFFVPLKRLVWESLHAGRLPLWSPYLSTGFPLLADFQSGAFYPPNWLYLALPFFTAFNWILVLHFVLGGLGAYFLVRELDFGRPEALCAAVSYMLGGYFVSLTNLINVLQAAAWAPLLAWSLLRQIRRPSVPRFLTVVAIYLGGFLAGAPETFLLAAATAALLALLRATDPADPEAAPGTLVVTLPLAALLVLGLAAIQLLPTVQLLGLSARGTGLRFDEASNYSLVPIRLVHAIVPDDFTDPVFRFGLRSQLSASDPWLFSIYLGVVTLLLAVHAAWDRNRREVLFWAALGVVGIVLALGRFTPVYGFLYAHVPGIAAFRYPEKFYLLTGLSGAMLSAYGLRAVLERRCDDRLGWKFVLVIALLAGAMLWAWHAGRSEILGWVKSRLSDSPAASNLEFAYGVWTRRVRDLAVFLVAGVALLWAFKRGFIGRRPLTVLVPLLLAADFWLAGRHLTPVVDESFYDTPPTMVRRLGKDAQLTYRYRSRPFNQNLGMFFTVKGASLQADKWFWQQTLQPNVSTYQHILTRDAVDAIHLRRYSDESDLLRKLDDRSRWRLLRLASVKYVYSEYDYFQDGRDTTGALASRARMDSLTGWLYEMKDPLPRAYVVEEAERCSSDLALLNRLIDPTFDPAGSVALEADSLPGRSGACIPADSGAAEPAAAGRARISRDEGETLAIDLQVDAPGWLVLTDNYYPGWHAYVDGRERPIERANYLYRAVRVRPGDRRVVFRYQPSVLRRGAWISAGTALAIALSLVGLLLFGREAPPRAEPS